MVALCLTYCIADEVRPHLLMRAIRRLQRIPEPAISSDQARAIALMEWGRYGAERARHVRVKERLRGYTVLLADGRPIIWLDVDGQTGAVTHPNGLLR
jgi:hypothetical protein